MEFFESWTFMALMGVLLVVLIGVFLYLRNQRSDED